MAGAYRFDDGRPSHKNIRAVQWHSRFPEGRCVAGKRLPRKALTDVTNTPGRMEALAAAIEAAPDPLQPPYLVYSILDEGCFLDRARLERLLARLRAKKNLILQGPPGTGKTWLAKRLAYALVGQRDKARISAVQFHPTLSYEDFVLGWRPGKDGLDLVPGAFLRAIDRAMEVVTRRSPARGREGTRAVLCAGGGPGEDRNASGTEAVRSCGASARMEVWPEP